MDHKGAASNAKKQFMLYKRKGGLLLDYLLVKIRLIFILAIFLTLLFLDSFQVL